MKNETKNETICECGHLKEFHGCGARDLDSHECKHNGVCGLDCDCTAFTAAKSLRDRLVEDCDGFNLSDGYCIEATFRGDWDVSGGGELVRGGFDTPEAAFAWLKDHLKEQK